MRIGPTKLMKESAIVMSTEQHYDAIVIGAGVCGIYQIKRLTELGMTATVLELGGDLGGTWYWNRYPGCRYDSESYTYGYFFSQELFNEWHWVEAYSPQPENLRYLNYVADKFDLRRHMQFNVRVESARWDEEENLWRLGLDDGRELSCRFLIMGTGLLSQPTMPNIDGIDDFEGDSCHTYYWPHEEVDLADRRVAVIGTGATAIQVIGEIADKVGDLKIFQRRANWAAPLNNYKIDDAKMAELRARYEEIQADCAMSPGGFEHQPDRRGFWEVGREERIKLWDRLYDEPGFGIWLQNFREIFTDEDANAELSEYIADRIRQRVKDPVTAEKLIPKDHGFGVQRVPLETNYYEAYNRDNVQLIDISETPIERVTTTGIKTSEAEYEFDLIIYATGFDAITGAFDHIDIRGTNGQKLKEKWDSGGIQTYLGIFVHGFPNMLMPAGPQSGSASSNYPRGIENGVNWVTALLEYARARDIKRVEAGTEAEREWTEHVVQMYSMMLMRKARSWFTGYNSNVAGHEYGNPRYLVYNGGAPKYVRRIDQVASDGYTGVEMDGIASERAAAS